MKNKFLIFILIIFLAVFLRFYKLGQVPAGFHQDEVSQAYNSYSLLKTGFDRYGQAFPILFRSFGSYQPPIYTYLMTVAVEVFGNTTFSARFTSAFFGVLTVILTFFIAKMLSIRKYRYQLSLFSGFVVAISPWAIHFSRRVVEANLGIFFFLLAFYLFLKSLKKISFFPIAAIVLGISTHAYYSERVMAILFLPLFVFFYRRYFLKYKKQLFWGILVFGLTLLPHIITVTSGAFASRFDQVSYFGNDLKFPIRYLFLGKEFVIHFVSYFSPNNLFSDIGSGLGRTSPGLGVFYDWFFVPFLFGFYFLSKIIGKKKLPALAIFGFVYLVPVSLTGDVFYPLRSLDFFWVLALVISVGMVGLFGYLKNKTLRTIIILILLVYSLLQFYISYFILYQHETTENVGNTYIDLSNKLMEYKDYKIVLDSTRDPAAGLRIAYFRKYDPRKLQTLLRPQMTTPYYSNEVNGQEVYIVDNIETRPIDWKVDRCVAKTILVGDSLAFSQEQIDQHHLKLRFEITGINKNVVLWGYETNPDEKCKMKI